MTLTRDAHTASGHADRRPLLTMETTTPSVAVAVAVTIIDHIGWRGEMSFHIYVLATGRRPTSTKTSRGLVSLLTKPLPYPTTPGIRKALLWQHFWFWRRQPDSNWRIEVLQTSALPLGYGATGCKTRRTGFQLGTNSLASRRVRTPGRESRSSAMRYCKYLWSGRRDSNPRPSPWQGDALPLSHFRMLSHIEPNMVARDGIEPPTRGFSVLCSTD